MNGECIVKEYLQYNQPSANDHGASTNRSAKVMCPPGKGRNAAISPLASLSLTSDHITDALAKSPDGGATLDLAYKGLTDVGESGADELSRVGEDELIGTRSSVVR